MFHFPHYEYFFYWCLIRISCAATFVHCLFSLSLCTSEKSLACLLCISYCVVKCINKIIHLSFSSWNGRSHWTFLVALYGTHSNMSKSFLYWETQNWMKFSRCNCTSIRVIGIITALSLLATLLPIQPSMQLAAFISEAHCWLTLFVLCQHSMMISHTAVFYPANSPLLTGLYISCRTWHLPLLNFLRYLLDHFSSLYTSFNP